MRYADPANNLRAEQNDLLKKQNELLARVGYEVAVCAAAIYGLLRAEGPTFSASDSVATAGDRWPETEART